MQTAQIAQTVDYVDLELYQGRWYAIATRRTSLYQAACRDRTSAEYSIQRHGAEPYLTITNRCRSLLGLVWANRVTGRIADAGSNARLFVPEYGGTAQRPNYYVLALGEPGRFGSAVDRYSWVLISEPDGSEAYLMLRDPRCATAVLRAAVPALEQAGFALEALFLEPQPDADFTSRGATRRTSVAHYLATLA